MRFDHHTEDFAQNWRAIYTSLRSACPVTHTTAHEGFYVLTRYDDVRAVLQDPANFACGRDLELGGRTTGGITIPANPVRMGMLEMDPPQSQAYRRILAPAFSAKAIRDYRPRMAQIVAWAVDRVIESGRIDFVDDLANPVPALVSLDQIGLPLDKWQAYAVALHKAAYREKGSARAIAGLVADLRDYIGQRRSAGPRHGAAGGPADVIGLLLAAEVDGAPVDDEMVTELVFMLLNGGIDTSTALIASMFGYLGEHRDHRAALAADPGLIPAAVEEMLRYHTPGTGVARTVTHQVDIAGTHLCPGDRLLLALGSANNDEAVFPAPDEVHLDRDNAGRHLAFGYGIHRCLGAFLAPAEMTVLLEEVLRRMPDYEIDAAGTVPYPTIPIVSGYIAMPATFTPGPRALAGEPSDLPPAAGCCPPDGRR